MGQFAAVYAGREAVAEPVRISIAIRIWCSGFRLPFKVPGNRRNADDKQLLPARTPPSDENVTVLTWSGRPSCILACAASE
jgi:hypothetical protein